MQKSSFVVTELLIFLGLDGIRKKSWCFDQYFLCLTAKSVAVKTVFMINFFLHASIISISDVLKYKI